MSQQGILQDIAGPIIYDTGTFVPVLQFGGGSTGITYNTQTGRYTRIGDVVFIFIEIILTSQGTDSGDATISGLPFIVNGETSSPIGRVGFISSGTWIDVVVFNNGTDVLSMIILDYSGAFDSVPVDDVNFRNNTKLSIQGMYKV